jgi:hypothetical protein
MLRRLVKLLRKIFRKFFGVRQERSPQSVARQTALQSPPELTNADLEYLFTQLQRMENRISERRWLEWLTFFGERLLASPVPNDELAFRMIQLGELEVGHIGEFAYDIGSRLLTRNSGGAIWQDIRDIDVSTQESVEIFVPESTTQHQQTNQEVLESLNQTKEIEATPSLPTLSLIDTPGQDLLREYGEDLWNSDSEQSEFYPLAIQPSDITGYAVQSEPLPSFTLELDNDEYEESVGNK